MIQINKGSDPKSLVQQRCKPEATYESPPWDKAALRAALIAEQKAVCAFCMQRIHDDPLKTKIAHVLTQSEHPSEQLTYSNLLAACLGGEGKPRSEQHCDTLQGSRSLPFNPADRGSAIDASLSYLTDGTMKSSNPTIDAAINDLLGLNRIAFLRNGRKATLDRFQKGIPPGTLKRLWVESQLRRWSGEDGATELEPYCGVVVHYLRKKLSMRD